MENKVGGDWEVNNSISIPKPVFKMLRPEKLAGGIAPGPGGSASSNSSFSYQIIGDRFELPIQVRQVLFQRDCEEIPLSENQLGYFSDLETLEWFWEIVSDSNRAKEVSPPSPLQTPPADDSTQEGEILLEDETKPESIDTQNYDKLSEGDIFVCETLHTPPIGERSVELECPTAPKKKRVLRRFNEPKIETYDFSQF